MIPAEAVEAARAVWGSNPPRGWRAVLEAATASITADSDLMRWKLAALKEWSDGMIEESNYPQYGRDVKTILEVCTLDEPRGIDVIREPFGWEGCPKRHASQVQHLLDCEARK